jgi:hypothetical protein
MECQVLKIVSPTKKVLAIHRLRPLSIPTFYFIHRHKNSPSTFLKAKREDKLQASEGMPDQFAGTSLAQLGAMKRNFVKFDFSSSSFLAHSVHSSSLLSLREKRPHSLQCHFMATPPHDRRGDTPPGETHRKQRIAWGEGGYRQLQGVYTTKSDRIWKWTPC